MVRLSGAAAAADGGLHVRGVYAGLLEAERADSAAAQQVWINPDDHPRGFFERSTALLEALKAGKTVVVPMWFLGGRSVPCNEAFREYKRRLAPRPRQWIVSPRDVIRPAPADVRVAFPGGAYYE